MSRRDWTLLAGLSVAETVSWGVLYYTFAVFLGPMGAELGISRTETAGAFSLGLLTSALAAPAVGRWIDRSGPRLLMTAGSIAGALLLLGWSRVQTLAGLYLVWAGVGVAMAAVLYEPAFALVAAWFSSDRDRALAVLTLVAGLASAIFVPLASDLTRRFGWRTALVLLAAILASTTIPIHASLVHAPASRCRRGVPGASAGSCRDIPLGTALRSPTFRTLALAFVIGGLISGAMAVHMIPCLMERGHSPDTSAAAVGLVGAMQIPGRLLFAPINARLPPSLTLPLVFGLLALALAAASLVPGRVGLVAFIAAFGIGNGMLTLTRAAAVASEFGTARYGSISGALAALTTTARAVGPVAAALARDACGAYKPVLWIAALGLLLGAGALRPR